MTAEFIFRLDGYYIIARGQQQFFVKTAMLVGVDLTAIKVEMGNALGLTLNYYQRIMNRLVISGCGHGEFWPAQKGAGSKEGIANNHQEKEGGRHELWRGVVPKFKEWSPRTHIFRRLRVV